MENDDKGVEWIPEHEKLRIEAWESRLVSEALYEVRYEAGWPRRGGVASIHVGRRQAELVSVHNLNLLLRPEAFIIPIGTKGDWMGRIEVVIFFTYTC